jgi:hypothetical protein
MNGPRNLYVSDFYFDFVSDSKSHQMALDSSLFRSELRVDPVSRCAALLLPKNSVAILPFYQTQAELDVMEQDQSQARHVALIRLINNSNSTL